MEKPHTVASPQVGLRSVARLRMVVVLPAPLGPMKPYTSPRSSFSVRRLSAYNSPYIFVRSRVSIIVCPSSVVHRPLQRTTDNGQRTNQGFFTGIYTRMYVSWLRNPDSGGHFSAE